MERISSERGIEAVNKKAKGAIVIPHLGASTEESEDNCAQMAVAEIRDFLENGNLSLVPDSVA